MMRHKAEVHSALAAEGLPTTGKGVSIHVIGEVGADHGDMVVRAASGPSGLAPGASIEQPEGMRRTVPFDISPAEATMRFEREAAAGNGTINYQDATKRVIDELEAPLLHASKELDLLSGRLPADGKTKVANISWGASPIAAVDPIVRNALAQGDDAPLVKEGSALAVAAGKRPINASDPDARGRLSYALLLGVKKKMDEGPGKERLDKARDRLAGSVASAREKGILTVAAAGNDRVEGAPDWVGRMVLSGTPGVVSVGMAKLGDVCDPTDAQVHGRSPAGASIAAPGVGMPVGPGGTDQDGTSFASPYVASVAALMIEVNPNITPGEIEHILIGATHDLKGTRDGAGLLDPVAAVRRARAIGTD